MRKLLTITLLTIATYQSFGQVTSILYQLEYIESTELYSMTIHIDAGSAEIIPHRAQFNAQISIVTPDTVSLVIVEKQMPLESNHTYTGTIPTDWTRGNPANYLSYNYHSISPKLSPASFFNDLYAGDTIQLFTFDAGGFHSELRLFDNASDPGPPLLQGGNFSNGYTLGGSTQLYSGNLPTIITQNTSFSYQNNAGQTFNSLETAIQAMPSGGTIFLLQDFEDNTVSSIPAGITIVNDEYELTLTNLVTVNGEIASNGTIIADLIVSGKIKGNGILIGNITNNGELMIGGELPAIQD